MKLIVDFWQEVCFSYFRNSDSMGVICTITKQRHQKSNGPEAIINKENSASTINQHKKHEINFGVL
ncbi:MAG: hypothetical protein E7Z81_01535 [Methanobrevibacter sp.]|jgi:hypothetical protein|uniref:hypothetical protein n=1 Tax=Methanobrevibacter sp. TaxID=66852 RepID=UPI0025F03B29|nr:hypothetical protein [Methanobrevibacter sp.]MBE6496957.1 hypothetical protein [Methanobrevibacter sp.]